MNKLITACAIATISFAACNSKHNEKEEALAIEKAKQELKDSLALDSFRKAEATEKEEALQEVTATQSQQADNGGTDYYPAEPDPAYQQASESTAQPTTTEKKGWSDAAKGTAIGAGVGAVTGALIDKDKRLRGAAIGAAVGGAGGYAIGRKKDRESGRVQK